MMAISRAVAKLDVRVRNDILWINGQVLIGISQTFD